LSRQVREILRRERFDIVHVHEPLMPALCPTVLWHSHAVNVGTFHAYREKFRGYQYSKPLLRRFFNRIDGLIAVSPAARDYVNMYFPARYTVIPNGIDVARFADPDIEPLPAYNDEAHRNILFVGRMEKRKGLKYLLRAFPIVKQACPEARLIVVGEGRLRAGFQQAIADSGLPNVDFCGYVSAEDLPRYHRSAHVFCAPATGFESFGIVLLEAMAAGLPVVASDIVGFRAVVSHGGEGLLVTPRDPEELARALILLLRNRELGASMGERGREKSANYDWSAVADRVLDFYETTTTRVLPKRRWAVAQRGRLRRMYRQMRVIWLRRGR
ncbi:MAG: glycosyltransferase family 4 protein, partial [Chloroflexi bacterium]|nr:glycosyltransferase family 4 protein [Chloroflexota bacterium]